MIEILWIKEEDSTEFINQKSFYEITSELNVNREESEKLNSQSRKHWEFWVMGTIQQRSSQWDGRKNNSSAPEVKRRKND